ncbi:TonB-dependent receptor [Flavobacterium sp. xlx-214]|uniref:outer membrane beta-barrel family protein n=1 Tax=unclassified Flavobacterium TaxID=196869 RepID=UPI0013D6D719|nr:MULTISPECIES: outer membrane beta-barrel family protein [unclassified Flavobacterium]MBA5791299.1 TonB-dependent receptor [Flavobacterium sp. xlx-221]QMI83543.1 TonB-dependent receptor [Flavobacterium sp. xlx-214]
MKAINYVYCSAFALASTVGFAQDNNQVYVKGTVIEASTNAPLEYASVTIESTSNPENITGDMTDASGNFNIPVTPDTYQIRIEYLGYKTYVIDAKEIQSSTSLGVIKIAGDSEVLEGIVIEAKRAAVELKLDKRIYNVADNTIVKGGSASDVLDNIPSVEVDSEGNVSLRGNESVKVLIDGKPSGMASNIGDALKMISADALDRVEVITNPSARYEAEGGAGIINIILKKGSNNGVNGSVTANVGDPTSYGLNGTLNFREKNYNFYTNLGYSKNKTFGNSLNESQYFDENGNTSKYVNEYSKSERLREGVNGNFGFEWNLTDKLTWNQGFTYRKSTGDNPRTLNYDNYDANRNLLYRNIRQTEEDDLKETVEYTTDFTYKFNDKGHQLFVSGSVNKNKDIEDSNITTYGLNNVIDASDITKATENELRHIARVDYVLPFNENSQFEAGYLGNFNKLNTQFNINSLNDNGDYIANDLFKNNLDYKETVHALYSQFGDKINKFSYMLGLRWEYSAIDVNQLTTMDFNRKTYNNFFPSAFLNYEFSDSENVSTSYSRRVRRPRGRMLNPVSNYSSSINFFMGNPDLNPSFTDAFDLGYMKRWNQFTLNASAYFNKTTDAVQFVRRVDGVNEEGIPITISGPINLATEYRYGLELNLNYNPFKWWRLNANMNLFQQSTRGDYSYVDFEGKTVTQNFDNDTFTWSGRLNSRVTLPAKIDWQTNVMYQGPQTTAQGKVLGNVSVNMALSKDVLKDKASIALNVQDLFNSRKRMMETNLPQAYTYSEMQWRERTINLAFTYRFNQTKADRQKNKNTRPSSEDMEDMM